MIHLNAEHRGVCNIDTFLVDELQKVGLTRF